MRERRFTGAEAELLALAQEDAQMSDAEGTQDEAFVEVEPLEEDEGGEEEGGAEAEAPAEGEAQARAVGRTGGETGRGVRRR